MTPIDRFVIFFEKSGLSNSDFAIRAKLSRPLVSQLLHGRIKSLNDAVITNLREGFPNLSIEWLLFGNGEMYIDSAEPSETQRQPEPTEPIRYAPSDNSTYIGNSVLEPYASSGDDDLGVSYAKSEEPAPYGSPKPHKKHAMSQNDINSDAYETQTANGHRETSARISKDNMDAIDVHIPFKSSGMKLSGTSDKKLVRVLLLYSDGSFDCYES